MRRIIRKILNRYKVNPDKAAMDHAIAKGLKVGKNFEYNSGYPIDGDWPWLITIGDDVTLATGVKLIAHDASTVKVGVGTKVGRINIGNNVFLGTNTIVLCNITIGNNVIVGAGSVVTNDIPSNSVYGGNPARFICIFEEYKNKHNTYEKSHPSLKEHHWREWINVSENKKTAVREGIKETHGYL